MIVKYNDLEKQYLAVKNKFQLSLDKILNESDYILGKSVRSFELNFANYIGTKYAIGVSNGTDAIKLALKSLMLEEKIIIHIQANTYTSVAFAALEAYPNANINIVDADISNQIDLESLQRSLKVNQTKYNYQIVILSHMYGSMCDMQELLKMTSKYNNVYVIEDSSQAHGTVGNDGKKTGSYGLIGTFSLYPGKNLGAIGDAGIITTNNDVIYNILLKLRNIGQSAKYNHDVFGFNHRMDSIQGAVLVEKLKFLEDWNDKRRQVANYYNLNIKNLNIQLPIVNKFCAKHTWHVYYLTTEKISKLSNYLDNNNIEYRFHYPILIEESPMFSKLQQYSQNARWFSKHHISIPIHPFMTKDEQIYVCDVLNNFK